MLFRAEDGGKSFYNYLFPKKVKGRYIYFFLQRICSFFFFESCGMVQGKLVLWQSIIKIYCNCLFTATDSNTINDGEQSRLLYTPVHSDSHSYGSAAASGILLHFRIILTHMCLCVSNHNLSVLIVMYVPVDLSAIQNNTDIRWWYNHNNLLGFCYTVKNNVFLYEIKTTRGYNKVFTMTIMRLKQYLDVD